MKINFSSTKSVVTLMNRISMLVILLFLSFGSWAKIDFKEITSNNEWGAVFDQAQLENKYVFVFVYTDWCGSCTQMKEEVFTEDSLAMDVNFISVKVNAEKEFGSSLSSIYGISGYPNSIFFDKDENFLANVNGFLNIKNFQNQVESIIIYREETSSYEEKLEQGKLNTSDKLNYLNVAYKANINSKANEVSKLYLNDIENEQLLDENKSFIVQSFITDIKSKQFLFLVSNEKTIVDKYGDAFYDVFIKNVFDVNLGLAIKDKNVALVDEVVDGVLLGYLDEEVFEEGKAGTYQRYYAEINDWVSFNKEVLDYYATSHDTDYLLDKASMVIDKYSDSVEMIAYAEDWLQLAEDSDNSYKVQMLYASLLIKDGRYKEALKKAKKARRFAESQEDVKSVEELIAMIEFKIEKK